MSEPLSPNQPPDPPDGPPPNISFIDHLQACIKEMVKVYKKEGLGREDHPVDKWFDEVTGHMLADPNYTRAVWCVVKTLVYFDETCKIMMLTVTKEQAASLGLIDERAETVH